MLDSMSVQEKSLKAESVDTKTSYGKTNLQKQNVDEPEILKLTENYIAYFNKRE
jgi:uncharacterized secreted protein with C-terminal beta-propeller domain